jgi:protein-S-isoprenylcysteine O-methyltransferase Ste14
VPGLALALLALYATLALGLRAVVQLQRTGSTGVIGISGRPGSIEWASGVLFELAIGVVVAGAILDLSDVLDPISALDESLVHGIGIVFAAAGLAATLGAQFAMGDSWRVGVDPGERTELVTDGPFSVVRNPIYAGVIPFFAGIALLVPNLIAIGGFALLVLGLELQTRLVEEPYLRQVHGSAYAEYAARVGRFFPGVGRLGR